MPILTKSGNISSKVSARCTVKRAYKIEQIARLTAEGYKDDAIALVMGITIQYVSMLRRTPEYIAIDAQVRTGMVARADRHLFETEEAQRAQLNLMVPDAISVMRKNLFSMNPRIAMEAAKEILDREGTHIKVSKTEVKQKHEFDWTAHSKDLEDDLLSALQSTNKTNTVDITDFVNASLDGAAQEELHKQVNAIKLEDIGTSGSIN